MDGGGTAGTVGTLGAAGAAGTAEPVCATGAVCAVGAVGAGGAAEGRGRGRGGRRHLTAGNAGEADLWHLTSDTRETLFLMGNTMIPYLRWCSKR